MKIALFRRKLPLFLVAINVTVSVLCFVAAISSPEKRGLAPIIVFGMDVPVSFLLIQAHSFLWARVGLRTAMALDGAIFTVGGALWFYALGLVISKAIEKISRKSQPG